MVGNLKSLFWGAVAAITVVGSASASDALVVRHQRP